MFVGGTKILGLTCSMCVGPTIVRCDALTAHSLRSQSLGGTDGDAFTNDVLVRCTGFEVPIMGTGATHLFVDGKSSGWRSAGVSDLERLTVSASHLPLVDIHQHVLGAPSDWHFFAWDCHF